MSSFRPNSGRPRPGPARREARPGRVRRAPRRLPNRSGFALLITIVLVAFLVLLLVGLATFTRVETQVAGNSQQLAGARQNALMALNIALGQLQKTTGPDQRVTATADLASAADGGRLPAGQAARNTASPNGTANGLQAVAGASVQGGTRHWTGVWGRAGIAYDAKNAKSIYEETPSPVLLNWLVSGNEDRSFAVDANGLVQTSLSDASTAARTATFTPGAPVIWSAAGLNPADPASWNASAYANLEIKSAGTRAVLLVGPRSAGTAPASDGTAALERYVVAPLRDIQVPASQVPGMGGAGDIPVGRYAWWVGDQGVKADFTLADPHPGQNSPDASTTAGAEARLRLLAASRSGLELVPDFAAMYPLGDDTQAAEKLSRVLDLPQAPMLAAAVSATLSAEDQRARFHDLATATRGVVSDTLSGGLRKDLTFYFEKSQAAWDASDLAGKGIIPSAWSPEWSASNYAPKWDWLYSFYNTNPAVGSPSLGVRPETSTRLGVSPVVAQFRMVLSTSAAALQQAVPNVKTLPADKTFQLPIRCNVVFVLANPYNFSLAIGAGDLQLLLKNEATGSDGVYIRVATGAGKDSPALAGFNILRPASSGAADGFLDTVKFEVPALTIPPGETVTLAIDGNGVTLGATNAASAEPANTVALSLKTGADPVVSTDYFTARTTLDFVTTAAQTTVGAALWQQQNEARLALILRDGSGAIHQKIAPFLINKEGQVNSFAGTVFGSSHLRFLGPARRNLDWSAGTQSSTLAYYAYGRPYVDYNVRAGLVTHPNVTTSGVNSYALLTPPSYAGGVVHYAAGGAGTHTQIFNAFSLGLHPATWAEDFNDDIRTGAARGVLFDFPRRDAAQPPVLSVAQLQHANLATNDISDGHTIGYESGYAVGNSYHAPHVTRGSAVQARNNRYAGAAGATTRYFDMSYLLNTALWDGYYFSAIAPSGADFTPRNPRYELAAATPESSARSADSAAHLTLRGAFNINSTSKEAWVALLGGLNGRRVNDDAESTGVPYPRSLWQPEHSSSGGSTFQTTGTGDEPYAGYRRLTAAEIDRLADEIVKRVRARGPFVSVSHFINRTLVAASGDFNPAINDANGAGALADPVVPMGRGLSGPLQAAIDSSAAGINTFTGAGAVTANGANAPGDRVLFNGEIVDSLAHKPGPPAAARHAYYADKDVDAPHIDFDLGDAAAPGPAGRSSTGIPGWLLQGDVLQAIGPALSARSDTFVIRAYGETLNPADPGRRVASAWCEAVVQRLPAYVEAGDAPETPPALASALNQRFGRKYHIVSFRWLSPEDI